MNEVGIIILNYGSAKDTVSLATSLRDHDDSLHLVIVDNFSSNSVLLELREFVSKVDQYTHLIENSTNEGYGRGNNIGIAYVFDV